MNPEQILALQNLCECGVLETRTFMYLVRSLCRGALGLYNERAWRDEKGELQWEK